MFKISFILLSFLIYLKQADALLNKEYCKCRAKVSHRIIGGNIARQSAFPWQVSIGLLPDTPWAIKPDKFAVGKREDVPTKFKAHTHSCGGAILSDNLILTAAHCVTRDDLTLRPITSLGVGVGNNHNLVDIYNYGRIPLEAIYVHPNYNISVTDTVHDIAVLKLAKRVDFDSQSISPACILQENEGGQMKDYDTLTASGWGSTSTMSFNFITRVWDGYKASLQLKETTFKDMSRTSAACIKNNKLICIGPLNALKVNESLCKGDSGGPLHYILGGRMFVVGLTSFGSTSRVGPFNVKACVGEAGATRVQSSLDWLKSVTGDDMCLYEQRNKNKEQLSAEQIEMT